GTPCTCAPSISAGPPSGAITITSWPSFRSGASEWINSVTMPLTAGRNVDVTMAMRSPWRASRSSLELVICASGESENLCGSGRRSVSGPAAGEPGAACAEHGFVACRVGRRGNAKLPRDHLPHALGERSRMLAFPALLRRKHGELDVRGGTEQAPQKVSRVGRVKQRGTDRETAVDPDRHRLDGDVEREGEGIESEEPLAVGRRTLGKDKEGPRGVACGERNVARRAGRVRHDQRHPLRSQRIGQGSEHGPLEGMTEGRTVSQARPSAVKTWFATTTCRPSVRFARSRTRTRSPRSEAVRR